MDRGYETMNCKEIEELIPIYMSEGLELDKLKQFIEHIDSCNDCRDELEVRFLVKEGLSRLEDGESFDLKAELDHKLSHSKALVLIASRMRAALAITGVILTIVLLFVVLGIIIL